jgi:hypothetical protein
VSFAQATIRDRRLDRRIQLQQSQRVGDRRPGAPHAGRDSVLGKPEVIDQLAVGIRFLDRSEVGPLHVLDQRELELLPIHKLANHGRDAVEPGELRGAEAALTRDQLVAVERFRDQDGLDDAVLGDACGEPGQRLLIHGPSRLPGVRPDPADRDLHLTS